MSNAAKYQFIAAMDVDPAHEDLFNEVYDEEHVPMLLKVPGVVAVSRYKTEDFMVSIGGEAKKMEAASPRYIAVYDVESPDVVASDAWAAAVEEGRWPEQVRPHTSNRRHEMRKKI